MEYVVTAGQMKEHERFIMERMGMDAAVLMERAALFTARAVRKVTDVQQRILIVCGTGNNGADGLALARILTEQGYCPDVLLLGEREKDTPLRKKQEQMLRNCMDAKGKTRIFECLTDTKKYQTEYAVIVDAVLGIGAGRELSGELKDAVEWMNDLAGYKIAMDVPTGICSDTGKKLGTAFRADRTMTFGFRKQGLLLGEGKVCAGEVVLDSCGMKYPVSKGLPVSVSDLTETEKRTFILEQQDVRDGIKRNPLGNKSTFGKIGILAGSEEIAGAAILNVTAAFRSGGGYVRLCTHEKNKEAVLSTAPETVLDLYGEFHETADGKSASEMIGRLISFADVICAGSGLGTSDQAGELLGILLSRLASEKNKTLILDADALNLIAKHEEIRALLCKVCARVIMTPHVVEFSRLCNKTPEEIKQNRVAVAREYAGEHHCILVLKDAQTVIADESGNVCISSSGNDGMAVAGSGDVLAGIIAGVAGQMKDPYMAAGIGVYLHAAAGDMAARKYGSHSMLPTDMIQCLKKCMKKLGKEAV